jgi:hypothetical protein
LYERLESRQLLAGDVLAYVIDGDLHVVGDNAANVIEILGTGVDGEVLVRPAESGATSKAMYPVRVGQNSELVALDPDSLQPITTSPTLINGSASEQLFTGVRGDVWVVMRDGRDLVAISNIMVHENLIIIGGAGPDGVVLGRFPAIVASDAGIQVVPGAGTLGVAGSLQVVLGAGDDRLTGNSVYVVNDVLVDTAEGNDRPEFIGSSARNMSFSTGAGDDRLLLDGDTASGAMTLLLGDGANDVQLVNSTIMHGLGVVCGGSSDQLRVENTRIDSGLVAVMGDASDYVELARSAIVGTTTVLGGAGHDKLAVDATRATTLSVDLGQGNDQFLVTGAMLDALYAQLGDGDDWLDVAGSVLNRWSALGGVGFDSLGMFAGSGTALTGAGWPMIAWASPQWAGLLSLGFEAKSVPLPASIRETPVPNIRFLVQTIAPTPGSGDSSGGYVGSGGVIIWFPRVELPSDGGPILVGASYGAFGDHDDDRKSVPLFSGGFIDDGGGPILSGGSMNILNGEERSVGELFLHG